MTDQPPEDPQPPDDAPPAAPPPVPPVQVGPRPDPARAFDPAPGFLEKLHRKVSEYAGRDLPAEEPEPDPAVVVAAVRATAAQQAWLNSIAAGNVLDLVHWQLDRLSADQHPGVLRAYADALGDRAAKVRNLIIAGGVGPGKTSAAIAVGNAVASRGLLVRFVRHSAYLKWLRPEGTPKDLQGWQIRRRFRDCDVLILDDLAAELNVGEPVREFVKDETLNLIGDRVDTPGKATIVTTNLRADALRAMFGEQVLSRLGKDAHVVTFTGPDRRGRLDW